MHSELHSANAHAAYIDLLRILKDAQIAELRGRPLMKIINRKKYWYDNYRIGKDQKWSYIGEDSQQMRDRLERQAELKDATKIRTVEQTRLVKILRAEGLMRTDAKTGSLLAAFAKSGVFRLGGTLVGTVAFRLYEGELGVRITSKKFAQTEDIDFASFQHLSLALHDQVDGSLQGIFRDFKFEPVPSLELGRVWRWKQAGRETLVEFLTPGFRDEGIHDLPALGVSAQALRHLKYLIAEPIHAVALYRSGILVKIPAPERYAIHKLIVADRRRAGTENLKAVKDRAQAEFLIEVLNEQRPWELAEAYEAARNNGAKWCARLDASLGHLPQSRKILDRLIASMQ